MELLVPAVFTSKTTDSTQPTTDTAATDTVDTTAVTVVTEDMADTMAVTDTVDMDTTLDMVFKQISTRYTYISELRCLLEINSLACSQVNAVFKRKQFSLHLKRSY